jgi:hypothetical protein
MLTAKAVAAAAACAVMYIYAMWLLLSRECSLLLRPRLLTALRGSWLLLQLTLPISLQGLLLMLWQNFTV